MKDFLTTGEAARLLNISRSTVSRKFDRGILSGQKSPITGERLISRESVEAFMRQYGLTTGLLKIQQKSVHLVTPDEVLVQRLRGELQGDQRIAVESFAFGADALIACVKERPDLLIVDAGISDIVHTQFIASLKRAKGLNDLSIVSCLAEEAEEDVERMKRWGASEVWTRDEFFEAGVVAARIHALLGLARVRGGEVETFEHKRRWPRYRVRVPAYLRLSRLSAPSQAYQGKAVVDNISRGGAFLTGIVLESGVIPSEPFRMQVQIDQPPLEGWSGECRVVRLQSDGQLSAGLQFVNISRSNLKKIDLLLHAG